MKERPILFSGPMVRAILEGLKSQTRRVVKPQPVCMDSGAWYPSSVPGDKRNRTGKHYANEDHFRRGFPVDFPEYGKPGDRLWVREAHYLSGPGSHLDWDIEAVLYRADNEGIGPLDGCVIGKKVLPPPVHFVGRMGVGWRPSIHMPRWASRITLEITSIRIERLQEITEEDAKAEGVNEAICLPGDKTSYVSSFAYLWDSINAKRGYGWDANPFVCVVEFQRVTE